MTKGSKRDEPRIREAVAYLHGRIERELEAYADKLSIPALELTFRVGALLSGAGPGTDHSLSPMPLETNQRHLAMAEMEGASQPHGRGARRGHAQRGRPVPAAKDKVVPPGAAGWAKFKTPAARRKEALRRMSMRQDPLAKTIVKSLRRGKGRTSQEKSRKQKIYQARHAAKLAGKPLPALPA